MKKLVYFFAAGAMVLAACSSEPAYKISGTVEGAADGEWVYLQEPQGRQLIKLDSAAITNGTFTFNGRQDTAVTRYISYTKEGNRFMTDLFLENGNITVTLGKENTVVGTPNNEAYQALKNEYGAIGKETKELYMKLRTDSTLTDEQRKEIHKQVKDLNDKSMDVIYNGIDANIANPVGAYLFPSYASSFSLEKQKALLAKMPAETLNNERIAKIAKRIETLEKTAVGQKFIDFSMPDPEGNMIKLSDIISKNKYTLIDFWASWCGPCRAEMPNVIEAYNQYHKKGFGIVGVSLDDNAEKWKGAIKDLKMPWVHMSDLKGWQCEGSALYGVNAIPATVLVAQDGTIIERDLRGGAIKKKLAELLK